MCTERSQTNREVATSFATTEVRECARANIDRTSFVVLDQVKLSGIGPAIWVVLLFLVAADTALVLFDWRVLSSVFAFRMTSEQRLDCGHTRRPAKASVQQSARSQVSALTERIRSDSNGCQRDGVRKR
jgi:hypothetical protein